MVFSVFCFIEYSVLTLMFDHQFNMFNNFINEFN